MKLEEIKRLNAERTQGEWVIKQPLGNQIYAVSIAMDNPFVDNGNSIPHIDNIIGHMQVSNCPNFKEDAAFIAAAPAMADMLVKLSEFEATPEFMDKVLARWDVYGKEGNLLENIQDVIDQMREDLCK